MPPEPHAPIRLLLVGSTGMVGRAIMERLATDPEFDMIALARREVKLPSGTQMRLADTSLWSEAIHQLKPDVVLCALGTTWAKAGRDEEAFRAVDEHLVLSVARAAKEAGTAHFMFISSAGADPLGKTLYLRVKGEVERALGKIGFKRLDILRPGLLRGVRRGDLRFLESAGIVLSPALDLTLHGRSRKYRSISLGRLIDALIGLAREKAGGRFIHEHDSLLFAAKKQLRREAAER
jgi:uncharacterized protein YbjT (DUF2867 family)